jgi:uncharacterized protein YjiK
LLVPVTQPAAVRGFRIDLDEMSALCVHRSAARRQEVLAIGDEDFGVHRALWDGERLGESTRRSVRRLLPDSEQSKKSEWEGIATDGRGAVYVLREPTATVFVFSTELDRLEHTIQLDVEGGDPAARGLLDDPNAGPEGLLLMTRGHVLVAKQKEPIILVEFGPKGDRPNGLWPDPSPPPGRALELLSGGERSTLVALAAWQLAHADEGVVQSANDLAVDRRGRLHAVSSKSRCIYRFATERASDSRITIDRSWALPEEIGAGGKRKAEGLTFDDQGRPLVALDAKDSDANTFVLESLDESG